MSSSGIEPVFFTTSQVGQPGPDVGVDVPPLKDAFDLDALKALDVVVTCQGGDYTEKVYKDLRQSGWKGYWVDAASTLRMADDATIVLDPVNRDVIDAQLARGTKTFVGGNCTVSLMLMGLGGLFEANMIEWMTSMTYQAASGSGAKHMRELLNQMGSLRDSVASELADPASAILDIDRKVTETMRSGGFPTDNFGAPLAGSLLPWIDKPMENGQSKEEWKGGVETNKILGLDNNPIPSMACACASVPCALTARPSPSSSSRTCRLTRSKIAWPSTMSGCEVIANDKDATIDGLTPAAATGTLNVPGGPPAQTGHGRRVPLGLLCRRPTAVGGRRAAQAHAEDSARAVIRSMVPI